MAGCAARGTGAVGCGRAGAGVWKYPSAGRATPGRAAGAPGGVIGGGMEARGGIPRACGATGTGATISAAFAAMGRTRAAASGGNTEASGAVPTAGEACCARTGDTCVAGAIGADVAGCEIATPAVAAAGRGVPCWAEAGDGSSAGSSRRRAGAAAPFPSRPGASSRLICDFDQNVVRPADHDEMFDIVPPDQHELPLAVETERVYEAEPRLPSRPPGTRNRCANTRR